MVLSCLRFASAKHARNWKRFYFLYNNIAIWSLHVYNRPHSLTSETGSGQPSEALTSVTHIKSGSRVIPLQFQNASRERKESGPLTTQLTMNRSVKFLTVEGIQKRKVPEKHYVSGLFLALVIQVSQAFCFLEACPLQIADPVTKYWKDKQVRDSSGN